MFDYFKLRFSQQPAPPFVIAEDILYYPFPLDNLLEGSLDAFIGRNFLSEDVRLQIKDMVLTQQESDVVLLPNNEGVVFPAPYSMVTNEGRQEDYFLKAQKIHISANSIHRIITKQLKQFTAHALSLLHTPSGKAFSPINFRWLKKKSKGLTIHCENSFLHQLHQPFLKSLKETVELLDQLSFLIVIDKPEGAGDIVLYNREWVNFQVKPDRFSDDIKKDDSLKFFKKNGQTNVQSTCVELKNGDLFVFRAGQIWHRVQDVGTVGDRITCGGFLAKSRNGQNIYFWS
jgi:hypothetical protein